MKKIISFSVVVLALGFLSADLLAQPLTTISKENPSTYRGTRQLGMGNAGIALSAETPNGRDEGQWFYNPASINDYDDKEVRYSLLGIQGEISIDAAQLVQDVIGLKNDINDVSTTKGKIDLFNTFVTARTGNFETVNVRLIPVMANHKWFSAGMILDSRTTISFRNAAFTNFEAFSRSDGGGFVGGAYAFFDDQLQVGLNLKVLHRLEISKVVTVGDILTSNDLGVTLGRGTGVGGDLGLKGKIPTFDTKVLEVLKPTVALVWQDVGNTRFTGKDTTDTEQSISTGFALHPTIPLGEEGLGSHFAVDFRELNQSSTFMKKLNIGYEVEMPKWGFFHSAVRAGANQGYWTVGATADLKYGKLEVATYGQELGFATREKESRRYAMNLIFGF
ncbi:MAG: hypothetical protein Q7S98_03705 [Deltaproteobacteria bacterium]|nr:hypothetical protein [Deltaproteobacteria bacterium]